MATSITPPQLDEDVQLLGDLQTASAPRANSYIESIVEVAPQPTSAAIRTHKTLPSTPHKTATHLGKASSFSSATSVNPFAHKDVGHRRRRKLNAAAHTLRFRESHLRLREKTVAFCLDLQQRAGNESPTEILLTIRLANRLFRAFDRNKDGVLFRSEIGEGMLMLQDKLGLSFKTQQPEHRVHLGVMATFDLNGTGQVLEADFIERVYGSPLREIFDEIEQRTTAGGGHQASEVQLTLVDYGRATTTTSSATDPISPIRFNEEEDEEAGFFHTESCVGVEKIDARLNPTDNEERPTYNRWVSIVGWAEHMDNIITNAFMLPVIVADAWVPQAAKFEINHETFDSNGRLETAEVAQIICQVLLFKNKPFTWNSKRGMSLKSKATLDKYPPTIEAQQINMMIRREWPQDKEDEKNGHELKPHSTTANHPAVCRNFRAFGVCERGQHCPLYHPTTRERTLGTLITVVKEDRQFDAKKKKQSTWLDKIRNIHEPDDEPDDIGTAKSVIVRQHRVLEELPTHFKGTTCVYFAGSTLDCAIDEIHSLRVVLHAYIDTLDDEVTQKPRPDHLQHIHDLGIVLELITSKLSPLVADLNELDNGNSLLSRFLARELPMYRRSRDQLQDLVQGFQQMKARREELGKVYQRNTEDQRNSLLFVLTVVTSVMTPSIFFAGVWGMNYDSMPELREEWMYPYGFWTICVLSWVLGYLLLRFL